MKLTVPLVLVTAALPAEAVSWKISDVPAMRLPRLASLADAPSLKVALAPEMALRIVAFPALVELAKVRSPVPVTVTTGAVDDELTMPVVRNWYVFWTEKV